MNFPAANITMTALQWAPWVLIFPSVVLLWFERTKRYGLVGLVAGYVIAAAVGQLTAAAALVITVLIAAGWAVMRGPNLWVRALGHLLFIAAAIALRLHVAPGFANPLAIEGTVSAGTEPFRVYLNLDKTLSGVWIVCSIAWLDRGKAAFSSIGAGLGFGMLSMMLLMPLAFALGVVQFDPKFPAVTWLWMLNNLVLVCFAEEVLFRGYVQAGLKRWLGVRPGADWIAIGVGAVLFGLSHATQGAAMVALTIIAGIGYGLAYRRAGLLGAIFAHGTLNMLHFLLLTYPALS